MKRLLIAAAAVMAGTLALFLLPRDPAPQAGPEPADLKAGWSAATNTDAADVFQRAFWRRPAEDDHILHAERIEWSDPGSAVAKWQWFLVIEPGRNLTAWLRETDPFHLAKADSFDAAGHAPNTRRPAWFPASFSARDGEVFRRGTMNIMFSSDGTSLFATGSGKGFAPAVAVK